MGTPTNLRDALVFVVYAPFVRVTRRDPTKEIKQKP